MASVFKDLILSPGIVIEGVGDINCVFLQKKNNPDKTLCFIRIVSESIRWDSYPDFGVVPCKGQTSFADASLMRRIASRIFSSEVA